LTDESGFSFVNAQGGVSVRVDPAGIASDAHLCARSGEHAGGASPAFGGRLNFRDRAIAALSPAFDTLGNSMGRCALSWVLLSVNAA